MNIAIVDDQAAETRLLQKYIDKYIEDNEISNISVTTFKSADEYLAEFTPGSFSVSFLDILMDDMNGVELARRIRDMDDEMKIVFCTSSNEYATESYEVNASQYLLKPYTYDRFKAVLKNVLPKTASEKLSILLNDRQRVVPRNIIYTEYFNHKITIHSKVGDDISTRLNQADFEELLIDFPYIIPCNRGIMINLYEIAKLEPGNIITSNKASLPVSRSNMAPVKEAYDKIQIEKIKGSL